VRLYFTPLLQLQRFFIPALIALFLWATWRTIWKRDLAVGLGLYLGLVIIVDGFLKTGIFMPGLEKGSIRYSEVCAVFLLFDRPSASPRRPPYGAVCYLVGLYFLLLLSSTFRSDPMMAGIADFRIRIVPQIIAFVLAMRGVQSHKDLHRFVMCLAALAVIVGLFVFWDLFFDRWLIASEMLSKPEYWLNRKNGRYGSLFLNPNYLGAFVVLIFPTVFVWTLGVRGKLKLVGGLGLMMLIFSLVETQSRGPLLAFGVVLLLLLVGLAGEISRTRRVAIFLPFVMLLALLMPGFFEHASERFDKVDQEMSTDSARTRQTIWEYTMRAISDHPLAGIGFGEQQFVSVIRDDYGFERTYGEESLDNPHNSYLQMTVYAGFPVLLVFLLANGLLLFGAVRSIVGVRPGPQTQIVFGLAVGAFGFLIACYPDMHLFTQTLAPVYWVVFGLLLSLATEVSHPVPLVKPYEDSRSHVGSAQQRLARESTSRPPRHQRDCPRTSAAGADRWGESRTAAPDGRPVRSGPHTQQAALQPGPVALPRFVRVADGRGEFFPGRRPDDILTPGADARRRQH
jgi:O-antigen ligase